MKRYVEHHLPDQVPGFLQKLDDPYGITWRVVNVFRRISLSWLLRFAAGYVRGVKHERPVFIVGMPRSGTTFLFYLIRESSQLASLQREGHDIWRLFHHPRYSGWGSDHVGAGEVRKGERRVINAIFFASAGRQRFIEKTADNCVRLPYLIDLFPDATFVVMTRNPCEVINSYINGWHHPTGRFRSYFVPEDLSIPDYPHRRQWCSTLIRGWRDYRGAPVSEIAFAQWQQYVEAIVQARQVVPLSQWIECHLEDLLRHPEATTHRLYAHLGIENEARLRQKLTDLCANPINAMTPPGQDKWRSQNEEAIRELLPRIAAFSEQIGYHIDPDTGDCEIVQATAMHADR